MELHGNPNDYAWGPSGLDDIISFVSTSALASAVPLSNCAWTCYGVRLK